MTTKRIFLCRNFQGIVEAACIDDKSDATAQDVAQWVREHRHIEYGLFETVVIGKPLESRPADDH